MTEEIQNPEIEFIRFKQPYEDLAGYVTIKGEKILIEFPLIVELENIYEEGRQALYMREFLPQQIISTTSIEYSLDEILFHVPVKQEFADHYEQAKEFFFFEQIEHEKKVTIKKGTGYSEAGSDSTEEATLSEEEILNRVQKVVSFLDAMKNKKDKLH